MTALCPEYPVSCEGLDVIDWKTICVEEAGGQFFTFQAEVECSGGGGLTVDNVVPGCAAQSCTVSMLDDIEDTVKAQVLDGLTSTYGACTVNAIPVDVSGVKPGTTSDAFSRTNTAAATFICLVSVIVGVLV
eukprot:CAMPEP_0197246498 /NCGR_PEP_ID=MMETSP1429-20130617/13648_1 /TAXON_ID=49237 /ORGANISM="Chaetoceros  sp., Strain UNC1202" /LENGTH=131 /DNA_ID=CAMNT_0042707169 /DNA_START=188 /DNA_END=583 /DNA_ORIENTATION=+